MKTKTMPLKIESTYYVKAKSMYISEDGSLLVQLVDSQQFIAERMVGCKVQIKLKTRTINGYCYKATTTGFKLSEGWSID